MAKEKFERTKPHVNVGTIDVDSGASLTKLAVAAMARLQYGLFSSGGMKDAPATKDVGLGPFSMGEK